MKSVSLCNYDWCHCDLLILTSTTISPATPLINTGANVLVGWNRWTTDSPSDFCINSQTQHDTTFCVCKCVNTRRRAFLLVRDVNIRLERSSDPDTIQFNETITSYGLTQHVCEVTHDRGGTLDMVCSRDDLPSPTVNVVDIGISDHRMIQWLTDLRRPQPIVTSSLRRVWRLFDADVFKADLRTSPLCDPQRFLLSDVEDINLRLNFQPTARPTGSNS